ncbi:MULTISPECIES: DUF881 domain-containing protein [unclassified Serinicoccus]|uniref:DUF881 domain-containing protein n=1 Tax=unclassified Serinicoccus TaxID=2643101 RepID=UPI003853D1FC
MRRRDPSEPAANPAASMALLEEVLDPPVGPGYHSAARERAERGLPPSSGTRTPLMFVTAVVLGLVCTVAAVTLRAPDPAAAEGRAQLIERIEAAQAAGDQSRQEVEELRSDIGTLEETSLGGQGPGRATLESAAEQAGAVAMVGPGVRVQLEDAVRAPDAAPGEDADPERVNARDLQLVVNGLWAAGAEAVSVNGHRMTSTSAIRFAGEAIIVDYRGLAPPYLVEAIGDPDALAQELDTGLTGAYLGELRRQLGLRADVTVQEEVTIGAGERLTTVESTIAPRELPVDPTPGQTPTPTPGPTPAPTPDDDRDLAEEETR